MYSNHITLIVTGSIAAVKTFDLIQQLQARSIGVSVLLTQTAQQWLSAEAATMATGTETLTNKSSTAKIEKAFAQSSAIIVAPATADFIKQLHFQDSKLVSAVLRSEKPVILAPAMNVMMWHHPATQRNVKALQTNKRISFLGPVEGNMACGDHGYGRFMEPVDIAAALIAKLDEKKHKSFDLIKSALDTSPRLPVLDNKLAAKPHKKILLMIQGGSDALATYSLISSLRARGHEVTCAATPEVATLLPEQGMASVSETPAYTRHYQEDIQGMEHIRLPERSDMVLIAPATAEAVKDMVEGGAQGFLGCLYLATKKPVLLVPSCDTAHQPAKRDLEHLKQDGVYILNVTGQLSFASKARAEAIAASFEELMKQYSSKSKSHVG